MNQIYYSVMCHLELRNNCLIRNWFIMLKLKKLSNFRTLVTIKHDIGKYMNMFN
jgi:hypothetical protein